MLIKIALFFTALFHSVIGIADPLLNGTSDPVTLKEDDVLADVMTVSSTLVVVVLVIMGLRVLSSFITGR